MCKAFAAAREFATNLRAVLVTGESGTGKATLARAIHRLGPTAKGRFVACNLLTLKAPDVARHLFGAVENGRIQTGALERAEGGSLFLKGVDCLSPSNQLLLLRTLQQRQFNPAGSVVARPLEARVIASTTGDLQALRYNEQDGRLYEWLASQHVALPSLRQRTVDIPLLAQRFLDAAGRASLRQFQGLSSETQQILQSYPWPGNVRELENVIYATASGAQGPWLLPHDLPLTLHQAEPTIATVSPEPWEPLPLEWVRRKHIERVLRWCGGNRFRAAKILGIGRTSLYRYLKRRTDLQVCPAFGFMVGESQPHPARPAK